MTKKKSWGGARPGGGRPRKADEQKLYEKLQPHEDAAHAKLREAIDMGQKWAVTLYFNYLYGKPRETKDLTVNAEQPLFDL